MPALRLFHRRTLIGGDDLQLPSLLTTLVRLFQSIFLLLPLWMHIVREATVAGGGLGMWLTNDVGAEENPTTCEKSHYFPLLLFVYITLTSMYTLLTVRIELLLYRKSGIGTPTQPELRHPIVANLLELKLVPVAVTNALVFVLGAACLGFAGRYYTCLDVDAGGDDDRGGGGGGGGGESEGGQWGHYWWYAFLLLLLMQFAELIVSALALARLLRRKDALLLPPLVDAPPIAQSSETLLAVVGPGMAGAGPSDDDALREMLPHHHRRTHLATHELTEQMWHSRCQLFCRCLSLSTCFLFGGREIETGDYGSIARALADYFETGGVLDLVPSDIAAGMLMLHRVQRERVLEARRDVIETKRSVESGGGGIIDSADSSGGEATTGTGTGTATMKSVSSLRDTAVKRSVQDCIFPGNNNSSTEDGTAAAQAGVAANGGRLSRPSSSTGLGSRENSQTSFGTDPLVALSTHLDPTTPPPRPSPSMQNDQEAGFGRGSGGSGSGGSEDGGSSSHHRHHRHHPSALAFKMEHTDTRTWYETTQRSVLCRNDESDRAVIAEGARFARPALAIYTWVLYVYMHPLTGHCTLGCAPCFAGIKSRQAERRARRKDKAQGRRRSDEENGGFDASSSSGGCGGQGGERRALHDDLDGDGDRSDYGSGCPGNDDGRIIGDNCCHAHRTALLSHAGLDSTDLAYAQLKSSFQETPYCIVVDHRWRSVVLAVRGTLSLEDCVVDVLVDPEPLDGVGAEFGFDGTGQSCHSGALVCTQWIYRDLQSHGILERLLLGPNAEYPHYNLRIVGHSIGAACATLLSYMLRRRYPNLRCLCYSPPGGFLTWKLATECKDFCTSFVLDSDLVPRLSVDTMEHLRNEVLELIGRLKVPKIEVVEHVVTSVLPCVGNEDEDADFLVENNARMLHPKGCIPPETDFSRQLEQVRAIQSERRRSRGGVRDIPLYPPGRICHLVKTGESKSCRHGLIRCITCFVTNIGSEYTPVWVENDDFNEIVVSPTMGTDHFPDRVCLEIEGVAAAFGLDTSLGSSPSDRERASLSSPARDPSQMCNDERDARRIVDNLYCE